MTYGIVPPIDHDRYQLPGVFFDRSTAVHLRRELEELAQEFAGHASREEIEAAFAEAVRERAESARVRDFLPVFVRRRVCAELKRRQPAAA